MKKILIMAVAILLVIGMVAAGTWAYFYDTETSSDNVFQAGTIELTLGELKSTPAILNNMKPGDTVTGSITVTNAGSLIGKLYGRTSYTTFEGQYVTDDLTVSDLGNVLIVTRWKDNACELINPGITFRNLVYNNPDPKVTVLGTLWHQYGELGPGASLTFEMDLQFDPNAGNAYQNDGINVTFEFLLYQQVP